MALPDEAKSTTGETPTPTLRQRIRGWAPILLPFLLVGVLLGPHLIGVRSLSPADQLYNWEPWASEEPADATRTHDAPFSDNYDSVFPQRQELVQRIRNGDWPLWSSLGGGGGNLAIGIGAAAAAPSNAVALVTPGSYTPGLLKALELVGAWTFVFLFLRRVGSGRWPAALAGMVFALSGFQVVWVNWPHTRVAMFAAGILWAFDRIIERTSPDRIAVGALVLAATFLEGFPAVAAIGVGAAAIVLTFRLIQLSSGVLDALRRLAASAGAAVLGLMLTAIVTVPFAARLQTFGLDRGVPSDIDAARGLGTVLAPNALGPPGQYFGPTNYVEIMGFLGGTAVLLSIVGVAVVLVGGRPRSRDLLLGLTALCGSVMLLYSYGVEPLYDLFRGLPVLSTNPAGRVKASALMLLALSCGLALDRLTRERLGGVARWTGTAVTVVATAAMTAYLFTFARDAPDGIDDYVRGEVTRAVIVAVVAALAIIVLLHRSQVPRMRQLAVCALVAVAAIDAVAWVVPYWPRSEPAEFYPETPGHEFLADSLGVDRFAALSLTFFPGTSSYYGLRTPNGHVFFDQRWAEGLQQAGALMRSRTFASFEDPASASSPMLDRMGVTYWADPAGLARCAPPEPADDLGSGAITGDGSDRRFTFAATGPDVRGVTLTPSTSVPAGTELVLSATDRSGEVLSGSRELLGEVRAGESMTVAVAELEDVSGPLELELTTSSGLGADFSAQTCRAPEDRLTLAHTSGVWIYRRDEALPRVRWAGSARVVDDSDERLEMLRSGDLPADTVLLSEGPVGPTGGDGTILDVDDPGDTVDIEFEADGPGFIVVADPIRDGWNATVDGRPAEILEADNAGGAVRVDAGDHHLELSYDPPGLRAGTIVSAVALAAVLGLLALAGLLRLRRSRRAEADRPGPDDDPAAVDRPT